MTRAEMPGRAHLHSVPACSWAEALTDDEHALLAELGMHTSAPRLHLVPKPAAAPAEPTPAADLRRARRGQWISELTVFAVMVACAAWAVVDLLLQLRSLFQ